MKKLLSLISTLNITILTSSSIIGCNDNDLQEKIDNDSPTEESAELSSEQEKEFFEQNDIDAWTVDETQDETAVDESVAVVTPTEEQTLVNENKEDLNTIENLHLPSLEIDSTQKYSALNNDIINSTVFEDKRIRAGFKIKYYNAQKEGVEITTNNQKADKVWVEIIASRINPFWKGQTNRIAIILINPTPKIQTNLNTIVDQITPLKYRPGESYDSLNLQIVNNISALKDKPLKVGYRIDYYALGTLFGKNKTDSAKIQKIGVVYIKITAAPTDPNWTGSTNKLKVEVKESLKVELNKIRDINFVPISINIIKAINTQSYNSLNAQLITKINNLDIFKARPLAKNYLLKYYTWNLFTQYSEISPTVKQTAGKVYVEITAASTDRFWTGSTKFKIRLT